MAGLVAAVKSASGDANDMDSDHLLVAAAAAATAALVVVVVVAKHRRCDNDAAVLAAFRANVDDNIIDYAVIIL